MKQNSEEFNQIFVVSFLKKLQISGLDFEFWHTPNGGSRNKSEAGRLKLMGVLSGVPDLCLMAYNIFAFIEFKTGKGKISKQQEEFIQKSSRYGWPVYTVYTDNPSDAINQVGKIMMDSFGARQNSISSISASVLSSSILDGSEKS